MKNLIDQRTADNDIKFNGYTTYRRDRVGNPHGGICVYVKDHSILKEEVTLNFLM